MTAAVPLNLAQLDAIAATRVDGVAVEVPNYPRHIGRRICHIGVGGFHRAHQADYLHRLLQLGLGEDWGICGIALRAADQPLYRTLQDQDLLYSLWEVDAASTRVKVIGSLMAYVDASADAAPAIAVIADAATRIVSLTITEAGYCLDDAGTLNLGHPDIAADLARFEQPRSAPGVIVRSLAQRRAAGSGGLTLMSCDNLIENGHRLRASILGFAAQIDTSLAQWIADNVSFPSSMVDRITPAADPARNRQLCERWGVDDAALVLCEPWQQWILEDDFVAGRPAFEKVGVVLSSLVKRYEDMKVGLLNGGHSALSHLGLLCGHVSVHAALQQPAIARWLAGYMNQVATTLEPLDGVSFDDYQASLIRRFLNPAIEDRLQRLAQDSSQKFQQVLLPPLLKRLQRGQSFDYLAATLALWMRYLAGLQQDGAARAAYQDTNRDELISLAAAAIDDGDARRFMQARMPLPADYIGRVCARIEHHLSGLRDAGYEAHLATLAT
ncbi:mannitol dehydrogenase family protein [Hydrocarboniphaga sp.]|uniref:mannitol dehydrogenase family protein n=1 Tax=Hydrocarboniphaga sp. TaxID=2033016 RepID=UPI003D09D351